MTEKKADLLFVANLPPPWTGQGAIHKLLTEGEYSKVRLVHLPMLFSKTSASQGKISFTKIFALVRLILGAYRARARGIKLLYFSPGGPVRAAVVRDSLFLLAVRPVMQGTILVYHSSGVAAYLEQMPFPFRLLLKPGFANAEVAVQLSPDAPPDGKAFGAKKVIIIPNAMPDRAKQLIARDSVPPLKVLYVGVVATGKGVEDILLAARDLATKNIPFLLTIVGDFLSPEEETKLRGIARQLPANSVDFTGSLTGEAKDRVFRQNDVFCFPSFWHAETFPLVLIEALSFSMPIVASRWRGIPDLLGPDGRCGTIVEIHAIAQISGALEQLALDPDLRRSQSANARLRYEECFQVEQFFHKYDEAFNSLL